MVFGKLKSRIASGSSKKQQQQQYTKINELTSEVCKWQNESMQVPVLKAKLDILENNLKSEKRKTNRLSAILMTNDVETLHMDGDLLRPTCTSNYHHRRSSTFSMFDYPDVNIDDLASGAALAPASFAVSPPTLDPLLNTYQETNQQLLEKLKIQEMENSKLQKQISDLQYENDVLKQAYTVNAHNVDKVRTVSCSSTVTSNKKSVSVSSSYNRAHNSSVSDDCTDDANSLFSSNYSANMDTPTSLFFGVDEQPAKSPVSSNFSRNDHFHRTLRNKQSQESLLSMNKSTNGDSKYISSPKSSFTPNFKNQYYMPEPAPKKKRSIVFGHKSSRSVSSTISNSRPLSAFFL